VNELTDQQLLRNYAKGNPKPHSLNWCDGTLTSSIPLGCGWCATRTWRRT